MKSIGGKAIAPFLVRRLGEALGPAAQRATSQLIEANVRLAARIAVARSAAPTGPA